MFLDVLRRRNPDLLRWAITLHQEGRIPANSYVIDVDAVGRNAACISNEADRLGLTVFAMTKQYGRNPVVTREAMAQGLHGIVAVDVACARPLAKAGVPIGHIGHLTQVPRHESLEVARMQPDYWTVFNSEHARWSSDASVTCGRVQDLLVRIQAPGDRFYAGHEGGFEAQDILAVADQIDAFAGVRLAGVTTFPALLFEPEKRTVCATPNVETLTSAANRLRDAGRSGVVINGPGTTSTRALSILASAGVTQVEPGHALTGTTPWHAVEDLPEVPAAVYVSEVSHESGGRHYFYGGGLYADPVLGDYPVVKNAIVSRNAADERIMTAHIPPATAIDYYGQLSPVDGIRPEPGDTVLLGHRIQAFVTRAFVVPVSGISDGRPVVSGVWTVEGRPADLERGRP